MNKEFKHIQKLVNGMEQAMVTLYHQGNIF